MSIREGLEKGDPYMPCSFAEFFTRVTGHPPYSYQEKLATRDEFPELLDIPTGLGKTLAVVVAWLWQRRFAAPSIRSKTPRRLVYCLPMRVLVEQTYDVLGRCLDAARSFAAEQGIVFGPLDVHILMGGEELTDWAMWPEQDAILLGTQDMLLSRALNRGYAASRARWPTEFGLLSNDCVWVLDEVQLMGSGLTTTAQLDAFLNGGKQSEGLGSFGRCLFLWMSATIRPDWLETVDHRRPTTPVTGLSLEEKREMDSPLGRRMHATKLLRPAESRMEDRLAASAGEILAAHRGANQQEDLPVLTLVVVNTIKRAVALYGELTKLLAKEKLGTDLLLIHSRFRPPDRKALIDRLLSSPPLPGRIVVSTQVVEAGVDISAKILFTELAPWASLVQRFGRCNRKGEYEEARVHWLEWKETSVAPYEPGDLDLARQLLENPSLSEVGPWALEQFLHRLSPECQAEVLSIRPGAVIRRKDMLSLFDTTQDLAGNDIDISRYIRDSDEHDVQVFWREIPEGSLSGKINVARAQRDELCSVSVRNFRDFLENHRGRVWLWDFLEGEWTLARPEHVIPGREFLVASNAGGYSPAIGWHGAPGTVPVLNTLSSAGGLEATGEDRASELGVWQDIAAHTEMVATTLACLVASLPSDLPTEPLRLAARWHDRGKAHPAFLAKLNPEALRAEEPVAILAHDAAGIAKAPRDCWRGPLAPGARWDSADGRRRHFRHELASALAVLQAPAALIPDLLRDLVAYLVAAHHGKVRLSIRSLPNEFIPPSLQQQFARGIWEGDRLPPTRLGPDCLAPELALTLAPMELGLGDHGEPSWAERMLRLLSDPALGPFRLAYLEAILRAADRRGSAQAERKEPHHV